MAWVIRSAVRRPWWQECHPARPIRLLWQQRRLLGQLVLRELRGRYRGSLLGSCWAVVLPLVAVAVYAVVFGILFRQRWPGHSGSGWSYALILFSGLALFNAFAEIVQRSAQAILVQPNLVKKVVFPLEILPAVLVGGALVPLLLSLLVVVLGLFSAGQPMMNLGWSLLILIPFLCWLQGLAWFLAGIGTFLRDVGPMVGAVCPLLLFLTPIFYPASLIPEPVQFWIWLNPLAVAVETLRAGLTAADPPPALALAWLVVCSLLTWQLGFVTFSRLRPEMADVV
jgi:lipopolysaccharide transport system permease protein